MQPIPLALACRGFSTSVTLFILDLLYTFHIVPVRARQRACTRTQSTRHMPSIPLLMPSDIPLLCVRSPGLKFKSIFTPVKTRQVAPTVLKLLGLPYTSLTACTVEDCKVLPGL